MNNKKMKQICLKRTVVLIVGSIAFSGMAADINSITTGQNSSGAYEIQIGGRDLRGVTSYQLDNPPSIVVDIPNARSHLRNKFTKVTHPYVSGVTVIEGDNSARAVINMSKALPYELVEKNNKLIVVVKGQGSRSASAFTNKMGSSKVFFERGTGGKGKVQIRISNGATVEVKRQGGKIVAKLHGTRFAQSKRLNVTDFGTPVRSIDVYPTSLSIATVDDNYELLSYQNDDVFSIELGRPLKAKQDENLILPGDSRKKYTGEPLSLNFQDIEVRAVLQIIGEFTGTNIVVSDKVTGSITLRMNDVPWDQALDVILMTKGLTQQKNGDVIFIAPSSEIAKNKVEQYKVVNVEKEIAPTQQELIQVQYARAEKLGEIIEEGQGSSGGKGKAPSGLLSERGSIIIDKRTNMLIVNDVPSNIAKVRQLVAELDVAVSQVLVDARLVTAQKSFLHELGSKFGVRMAGSVNGNGIRGFGNGNHDYSPYEAGINGKVPTGGSINDRIGDPGSGLAAKNAAGSFLLTFMSSDFIVDLELSAMQNDGRGEVISSPRVIAQDGGEAMIKQSTQLAYSVVDSDRLTTTWKDIPLLLIVRPKIAPNNQIDMELEISKDTLGALYHGRPTINTNKVKTQVLVDSGETVVLGGVYIQAKSQETTKVPLFGDLPIVGRAFKYDQNKVTQDELLIFVTPRIVDKRYTSSDKFSGLRK